jgi:hypothetical protein
MSVSRKSGRGTTAEPHAGADDRRAVCRYAVVQPRAWLGWWEGEQFLSTPAKVSDISLRGCGMIVEQFPTSQGSVWFCPSGTGTGSSATATSADWIEAKVIESRKRLFGPKVVRIVFRRSFPYDIFKAVVYGPARSGGTMPQLWVPVANVTDDRDFW